MNVEQFIEAFRKDLTDHEDPPFWSDEEIVRFLNAAVQEANERAKLTEDRSTPAVCNIAVQAGVAVYDLHPSVLEIKRASLDGKPLGETSLEAMDACSDGWESRTGQPRQFIFEQASGATPARLRLVYSPTKTGTVALTVYRGALKPLSADLPNGKIELPERFQEQLKDWVYRCAYLKNDADTLNPVKAAEYESNFERSFGAKPDANVQRKQRDKRPPVVRSSW
ncbi:hypothetical protein LJR066_005706 [Acidovorax sp. LjRoot66]|uniref:phage adaptor protein n=1 Tax=Acidovorax sp. LjRoot66 TaxID=3342334 RepID=UPI003ECEB1A3